MGAFVGASVGLERAAVGAILWSSSGTGRVKRVRSGVGDVATTVGTAAGVGTVDVRVSGWLSVDATPEAGCVARAAGGAVTFSSDSGPAAGAAQAASAAINSGTATNRNRCTLFINAG